MRASLLARFQASPSTGAKVANYDAFLTARSLRRQPSAIRKLQPLTSIPGMISLGGGMPNPKLFPFKGFSVEFPGGAVYKFDGADMDAALQYSATPGIPELVDRLHALQVAEHAPPCPVSVAVTPGSQDGLAKVFDLFLEGPEDTVIVEAPTYSGSLAYLQAIGCRFALVPTDRQGLVPSKLAEVLDNWNEVRDGRKPRVLYTIPTGSNPTGASMTEARKAELYAVLQRHNILCIEDDPYYYLQYSPSRTRSLLSMDVDGRVIRCDSFSKILSAGVRVGVVTGPEPLINRLNLHNQASIMHTSGLSQMAILSLFRHWGVGSKGATKEGAAHLGGMAPHLAEVQAFYSAQCDAFLAAADKHLVSASGKPLAEYVRPSAGMFVWLKLAGVSDTMALIEEDARAKKVLLVPGAAFYPGSPATPYARAAFSTSSPANMDAAMQRLGELLREKKTVA